MISEHLQLRAPSRLNFERFVGAAKRLLRGGLQAVGRQLARVFPGLFRSERRFYRFLSQPATFGSGTPPSSLPLDVVYLALESDLEPLSVSVESVRRFLLHPIGCVHVVSARSGRVQDFCAANGCIWHDEEKVLGLSPRDIHLTIGSRDRSGWLFQQLLKLSFDRFCAAHHALVMDADTVLTSPQVFERAGKTLLLVGDGYHQPYADAYKRLLGRAPVKTFSFIAHQMLVDARALPLLRDELASGAGGKAWWQRIIAGYDRRQISGFSEYETLGNWYSERYPDRVFYEYWFNHPFPRRYLRSLASLTAAHPERVRSVSFHNYLK